MSGLDGAVVGWIASANPAPGAGTVQHLRHHYRQRGGSGEKSYWRMNGASLLRHNESFNIKQRKNDKFVLVLIDLVASGRMVFRARCRTSRDIEIVGINDLLEPDYLAYM